MLYYQVALVNSRAPYLTYYSKNKISLGTLIEVPFNSTIKKATIIQKVEKPTDFEALEILSIHENITPPFKLRLLILLPPIILQHYPKPWLSLYLL